MRELRQNASVYLERVKAGESLEVTERGHLIALLVPPSPAANEREALIAAGKLVAAKRPRGSLPARLSADFDSAKALDELRDDRL